MTKLMHEKADTKTVKQMHDAKTNKTDTITTMAQLETIQRMLMNFITIFIE